MAGIRPAASVVGTLLPGAATRLGLDPRVRMIVGTGDEHAACLGAAILEPGLVCDITGTAEPVAAAATTPLIDRSGTLETHPHALPGRWLVENPGFVSGGNLRWFRDQLGPEERQAEAEGRGDAYDLLCRGAEKVPAGSESLVFLPCMQGAMAPEWNGAARGVFHGLTLAHTRDHMLRALLEGSAYALRDILEAMANGVPVVQPRRGARRR